MDEHNDVEEEDEDDHVIYDFAPLPPPPLPSPTLPSLRYTGLLVGR